MPEKTEKITVRAEPARPQPQENTLAPLVDIYEEADGTVVLVAEVPGAAADKIDVRVDKGVLTVWADGRLEKPASDYAETYADFSAAQYFRAFALGDEIDRDRIESSLCEGVLTIRMPKAVAAKTRKIEVKTG